MEIFLPYGKKHIGLKLPEKGYVGTFQPTTLPPHASETELIERALDAPIASFALEQKVTPAMGVVIITSDNTRPCPNSVLLPPVLNRLNAGGVPDENITVVIALGLHRAMSDSELKDSVGQEIFNRVNVVNHDINKVVRVGSTRLGTPVEVFQPVEKADFRICVGNVEFHYFAGFSGGVKALIPGVASPLTINRNHSHMVEHAASAGSLQNNPVRQDLEEAAAMVGVDFILNVIVDEDHKVIKAAAGHSKQAHRLLCEHLENTGIVDVPQVLDLAIVSPGGAPKDINLYQAQKALDNCARAVRSGGVIVLAAECSEGYGNETFKQWMTSGKSPNDLLSDLRQKFILGGHKAAAIGKIALRHKILLASALTDDGLVGIKSYPNVESAVKAGFALLGGEPLYGIFPYGASTLPKVKTSNTGRLE